jgi:hypothetical protein
MSSNVVIALLGIIAIVGIAVGVFCFCADAKGPMPTRMFSVTQWFSSYRDSHFRHSGAI